MHIQNKNKKPNQPDIWAWARTLGKAEQEKILQKNGYVILDCKVEQERILQENENLIDFIKGKKVNKFIMLNE